MQKMAETCTDNSKVPLAIIFIKLYSLVKDVNRSSTQEKNVFRVW